MTKTAGKKVRCRLCGDIIQSMFAHDFRRCSCGKIAVDGGGEYLRIMGELENFQFISEELPNEYRGYSTDELLDMLKQLRSSEGIPEGTPEDKISAMNFLLREYELTPVHQKRPSERS